MPGPLQTVDGNSRGAGLKLGVGIEEERNRTEQYHSRELGSQPEKYGHKTSPVAKGHDDGMAGMTAQWQSAVSSELVNR